MRPLSSGTAAAVDRKFTLDHAFTARGYPEWFIGDLRFSAAGILNGHQLSHHITLLADGRIVVGETVQELTALALVTTHGKMDSLFATSASSFVALLTRTPR